jgi:hypothetical protein
MSETTDPRGVEFERRTRALLEESAGSLSARTRSRLTQARYAALEQYGATNSASARAAWQRWLPAAAVSAAVLAVLLMQGGPAPLPGLMQASVPPAASGDDLELLADRDALALAQDALAQDQGAPGASADVDYEFYAWAVGAAQDESDSGVGT